MRLSTLLEKFHTMTSCSPSALTRTPRLQSHTIDYSILQLPTSDAGFTVAAESPPVHLTLSYRRGIIKTRKLMLGKLVLLGQSLTNMRGAGMLANHTTSTRMRPAVIDPHSRGLDKNRLK